MIPGVLLSVALFFALPQWAPHGRRPLRSLFDFSLVRGPVGLLALGGSFASVAFVTFTSSLPLWLVEEHDFESDDPLIGWILGTFALAAGGGALLGGCLRRASGGGPRSSDHSHSLQRRSSRYSRSIREHRCFSSLLRSQACSSTRRAR
jgi:hypothetical protein